MENLKSKIIPYYMKENIDAIMEKQLLNANRYYAETNEKISQSMKKMLYESPEEFYKQLTERWNWHNIYYEKLLEPAFTTLIKDTELDLSPVEIEDLINVYKVSCLVDEATLIMSGAIKKYLDYNFSKISISDEYTCYEERFKMLTTPPIETFFAQYQIDHLYYIYMLKTNDKNSESFKEYLKNKYHAGDELIFTARFKKRFEKYLEYSVDKLLKKINEYKIDEEYKIKHFYFTLEHSDRKAFRDIITYDNLSEKLIASNLIGVSGFLLRKKILEYLNSSKILTNNGFIYQFSDVTIIKALNELKEKRRIKMEKNVRPYKQRGDTCAIACMMMILEYYKITEKANWYDEKRLYKLFKSKYLDGTPFSALAFYLSKKGLDITIYHSNNDLFNNDKHILDDYDFEHAMEEYKDYLQKAIANGTKVVNGKTIDSSKIKQELMLGNIIILAGELPGAYHAILICGYNENDFIVCDPLYKNKRIITAHELDKYMDTSIGKWFISVNDNTKEKDNLKKHLHSFEDEAQNYVNENSGRTLTNEKK